MIISVNNECRICLELLCGSWSSSEILITFATPAKGFQWRCCKLLSTKDKAHKMFLSELSNRYSRDTPLRNLGPFVPFWPILGHLGWFGPLWAIWAILGPLGHLVHSGLFWAIWTVLSQSGSAGPFSTNIKYQPYWPFRAILGYYGPFREAPTKLLTDAFGHCPFGGGSKPLPGWFGALF